MRRMNSCTILIMLTTLFLFSLTFFPFSPLCHLDGTLSFSCSRCRCHDGREKERKIPAERAKQTPTFRLQYISKAFFLALYSVWTQWLDFKLYSFDRR
ncbi:hypothetical protein CEXT_390441 [Caerostris extrusa]|uniref:Secreted protein n=1 Tax=Caerostris extrusa TaxID=172846 RepID=A0AAV4Q6T3_CAEEX|nr:hypothetical protein CEXT_390441 [Caerostris extrusa]